MRRRPPQALIWRLQGRDAAGWLVIRLEAAWPRLPRPIRTTLRLALRAVPGLRRATRQP